jgi:hypothetical protein
VKPGNLFLQEWASGFEFLRAFFRMFRKEIYYSIIIPDAGFKVINTMQISELLIPFIVFRIRKDTESEKIQNLESIMKMKLFYPE